MNRDADSLELFLREMRTEQIGRDLDFTRKRVRQIELQGLRRLEAPLLGSQANNQLRSARRRDRLPPVAGRNE